MTTTLAQMKAKRTSTRDIGFVEVCLPWDDQQKAEVPSSKPRQWATEVETSGQYDQLWQVATRLGQSDALNKRLKVPHRYMALAAMVLMRAGVSAWVRNMNGIEEFLVKAVKA